MYCIGTGTQYVAAKPDNYLYPTKNVNEARLFSTMQRASAALIKLPRRFYNISSQWSVRQYDEEHEVDPAPVTTSRADTQSKPAELPAKETFDEPGSIIDDTDYIQVLNIVANLKSTKNGCLTRLNSELSRINEEILDIEHFIEFSKLNVPNAYSAYKMLRDTLNERRRIKDAIAAATELYNNCNVDKIAASRDMLNNRVYKPRQLPGLFK